MNLIRTGRLAVIVALASACALCAGCATRAPAVGRIKAVEVVMVDGDSFTVDGVPVKLAGLPSRLIARGVDADGWIKIELPATGVPSAAIAGTTGVLRKNGFAGVLFLKPRQIKVETKR